MEAMSNLAFLLGGAALPAIILLGYFLRLDRSRPEPLGLVWKSVFYGFLATIPAIVAELALMRIGAFLGDGLLAAAFSSFVVAGLVEEGIKFWFVRRFLFRRPEFAERFDGVVYAICVSLGFAFTENVLYGMGGGLVLLLRAFTAVPMHAAASGIMGYWIGFAKLDADPRERGASLRRGLGEAVFLHGLYDFFLFLGSWTGILSLVVLVLGVRRLLGLSRLARAADDVRQALRRPEAN